MLILYRIYQFTIMWPLLLIATILAAVLTILFSFMGVGRTMGYYTPAFWGKIFCWLTFVRVTVTGHENIQDKQSYVFTANHQGAYDIFAIYGYLGHNFRWMMKKSLEKIPLVGYSCKVSGQIFVDNRTNHGIQETMAKAKKQLAGGMSVVVFPEGSRTFTGEVGPFKRGAYTLAVEFGLPVVPITIDGAFDVMPRTAKLPNYGHIKLTIHKPIHPGADGHDLQKLIQESRDAILSSLPQKQ